MADYLIRLVNRTLGTAPLVKPLVPLTYGVAADGFLLHADDNHWQTPVDNGDEVMDGQPDPPAVQATANPAHNPLRELDQPPADRRRTVRSVLQQTRVPAADAGVGRDSAGPASDSPDAPDAFVLPPRKELAANAQPARGANSDLYPTPSSHWPPTEPPAQPVAQPRLVPITAPVSPSSPTAAPTERQTIQQDDLLPVAPAQQARAAGSSARGVETVLRPKSAERIVKQAEMPPTAPTLGPTPPSEAPPSIHVSIGRIEVRAIQPPVPTVEQRKPAQPQLSLEAYLQAQQEASQ